MKSQSVYKKTLQTGLFLAIALFYIHGSAMAVDTQLSGKSTTESCQLTPVEKYLERHPESQWPPSRREEIRRCDKAPDQQSAVNPSAQGKKIQKK